MGDVINFTKYRKQREQTLRRTRAAENRVRHGRTKEEKQAAKQTADKAKKQVDHHRLSPMPTGSGQRGRVPEAGRTPLSRAPGPEARLSPARLPKGLSAENKPKSPSGKRLEAMRLPGPPGEGE